MRLRGHMLTIPFPCQQRHKMFSFITWLDQTPAMPAMTKNLSQHVLTNPTQSQQGHKMYIRM
jgi:hypothetical protein